MDTTTTSNPPSSHTLYYYNVDAILSELIRPVTPKHGNLARPRLIKPEPIRPQQLIMNGTTSTAETGNMRVIGRGTFKSVVAPSGLLNDRMEGARNPDPIRQQQTTPSSFAIGDDDDYNDDVIFVGGGIISNMLDYYGNYTSGISTSKRSRDDEDILYFKKSNTTLNTDEPEVMESALVTPNPIQYYTTQTSSSNATTPFPYHQEPQYIVYKNSDINHGKNASTGCLEHDYFNHPSSNNTSWTTAADAAAITPPIATTSVGYTIVKPIAMRPMDVIQHLNDQQQEFQALSCQKNLHPDLWDDGSMRVCG